MWSLLRAHFKSVSANDLYTRFPGTSGSRGAMRWHVTGGRTGGGGGGGGGGGTTIGAISATGGNNVVVKSTSTFFGLPRFLVSSSNVKPIIPSRSLACIEWYHRFFMSAALLFCASSPNNALIFSNFGPNRSYPRTIILSSSSVHAGFGPRALPGRGSRCCTHLSRHCFAVRPGKKC